jgi:hypothetical protein
MLEVGWVAVHDEKGLVFPNFSEHNTPNKLRAEPKSDADRAREYRERKKDSERVTARHETSRTEEKRREEKILPPTEVATSVPKRKRSQPADAVSWSADAGWQGITDADRQEWRQAYPACDLTAELAKAASWLKANPTRAHKSNWRRFVVSWLTRSQDKGGTNRTPGVRPDERAPPQPQANRRFFRSDAQRSMTDAEHAAWRRDQRQGGTVAALAGSIRLTEEVTQ